MTLLTKEELLRCLSRLGEELNEAGLTGELLLTGGAAMCLVHSARDMTKDIDALYEPKDNINKLAAKIAAEENLPEDWLNDSVKGFVGDNAEIEDFTMLKGLRITTVSTEYLLAMKLMSARFGERDYDDIRFLVKKLDIQTAEQADKILLKYYPPERILPKTGFLIEEIIRELSEPEQDMQLSQ